jgi:UDP-glucose 4-epimerase
VSDAVRAAIALMDSDQTVGEVFNIGSQDEIKIMDLAERVRALAGSRSEIVCIPYAEAYGENFEDMPRRVPAIEKIRRVVGWAPRIGLDEIIESVIAYQRALEPVRA